MEIVNLFFSFNGRVNRLQYFIGMIVIAVLTAAAKQMNLYAVPGDVLIPILVIIISVICFVASLALTIKRLRDIGWSPWLILLFFIPLVNLIMALICLFKAGQENRLF